MDQVSTFGVIVLLAIRYYTMSHETFITSKKPQKSKGSRLVFLGEQEILDVQSGAFTVVRL